MNHRVRAVLSRMLVRGPVKLVPDEITMLQVDISWMMIALELMERPL